MRTTRSHKTNKKNYKQTIHKRSCKSRSTANTFLGCSQTLPFDIENINEVLRVHKTHLTEEKNYWKVVPKDSCEVYKERRKRQGGSNRNEECTDNSMISTESENDAQYRKQRQKKPQHSPRRKSRPRRLKPKTRRSTKQPSSASTSRSTTSRSTDSSCFSSSEMDE